MAANKKKAAPGQTVKPDPAKAKRAAGLIAYWPRLLFIIPVVVVMWVPFYNTTEPSLGGVPFFYWYQLAWVLIGAGLVLVVYLLETRVTGVTPRTGAHVDPGATGDVL
jgi:hypothetical protein